MFILQIVTMVLYWLFNMVIILISIVLVIGLIKPSIVIRWKENPKRKDVVIYSGVVFVLVCVMYILLADSEWHSLSKSKSQIEEGKYSLATKNLKRINEDSPHFSEAQKLLKKVDSVKIEKAKSQIEQGDYSKATTTLEKINEGSPGFSEAQEFLDKVDSLRIEKGKLIVEQKNFNRLSKPLESISEDSPYFSEAQKLLDKLDRLEKTAIKETTKRQIEKEISSINEGVDFSFYRGSIEKMQAEIALFRVWANLIDKGRNTNDRAIVSLANKLKSKVSRLQIRELPKLRSEYAKKAAKVMWENDIEVFASGYGNKYINFTGGLFAANKNIKDFQTNVHETLEEFRFTQARYRWYEGDDEYQYYTIYEGKDSNLFND